MSVLPSREPKAVAQKAVRDAAALTVFVIVIRLFFTVSMLVTPLPGTSRWLAVFGLLDCGLLAALAYGVYRMSRLCTMLMLAYYVADQFLKVYFQMFNRGATGVLILVIGCIFLSIRAIFASFRYHSLTKQASVGQTTAEPGSAPSAGSADASPVSVS